MVRLPKVNYLVKGNIFKQKLVTFGVKLKRCDKRCVKDILRLRSVRPYDHVKHVANFKPHGRH